MDLVSRLRRTSLGTTLAISLALTGGAAVLTPTYALAQSSTQPSTTVNLSTGRGTLVNLATPMTDLFVANDTIADVQVRSPTQLYIFAKAPGETTIYASGRNGKIVYASNIRVGTNIGTVGQMLKIAMPDAAIEATPMNGMVLLTGTVAAPDDVAEAERLAQAFVGEGTRIVTRLKTATPLQVNLQVRIAEVSRDFVKSVGINLLASSGGFFFAQGRADAITQELNPLTPDPTDIRNVIKGAGSGATTGFVDRFMGLNLQAAFDLAEADGLITTLANPNLTALSGETASFLAGGEIPIPMSQGLGAVSVEFKQYGVSLAFTPTVLSEGRISMRVRPEVSQLTDAGSVKLEGITIPGLLTRRAETTVELGSGQSFMIGGLLNNSHNNSADKTPILGDLPVLGALFRSKRFRRTESELVIIVTPYLVKPVSANQITLPTDGYRAPNDAENFLLGQSFMGKKATERSAPNGRTVQTPPAAHVQPAAPSNGGEQR